MFLKSVNIYPPDSLAMPLRGLSFQEKSSYVHTNICIQMLIATLFRIAKADIIQMSIKKWMNKQIGAYPCGTSQVVQWQRTHLPMWEMQDMPARTLDQEEPLEWEMATHSSILAWKKFHGQRSLAGYSPWGHRELDMTEQRNTHVYLCK